MTTEGPPGRGVPREYPDQGSWSSGQGGPQPEPKPEPWEAWPAWPGEPQSRNSRHLPSDAYGQEPAPGSGARAEQWAQEWNLPPEWAEPSPGAVAARSAAAPAVPAPAPAPQAAPLPVPVRTRPTRGPRRGRRVAGVALTLAVLVAGGATAVALDRKDAAPVASRQFTQAWRVPAPAADDALIGSWVTRELLIRASTRGGIRAYHLSDGSEAWKAALPRSAGTVPCAMSPTLSADGIGTVALGTDGNSCTALAGIDAATGRVRWTSPLVDRGHRTATAARTYLQGEVATIVSGNFLGGLDVRNGRPVWGYRARGHYCNVRASGSAGVVLVDDYCADRTDKFTLRAYDGRTGRLLWALPQRTHTDVLQAFSGSPLIASLHTPDEDSTRVFTAAGGSRKLAVGDSQTLSGNDTDADHSARLVGDVLITPALGADHLEVDAFDVTTGTKLWTLRSAALATAVAGDDSVYAVSSAGSPQLVQVEPRTGTLTPVAALPSGVVGSDALHTGTVYVMPDDGGVLELGAQGKNGGARMYR
ncbi:PQQ-binding-like beta-propeller repeat protein [Streptomyces sp. MI02-7b]|uniref:outer membrane protein assembly factor BamB family protein n=1 Tax=Streptomyces sp. MI02-7b TaxID=462941 RepID=UPI0029A9770A|nr:PQQ-binding-like beta-propeller repeat protein [Streptomyces sp. MI02-7b]MDX3072557.1 PQQ-binding-like beta-propeller repeat protein [Streptomyces sp. MI02-7b]